MVSVSLCDLTGMRSEFDLFQVELCRNEDQVKILCLEGHHITLDMWLTLRLFEVSELTLDLALDICDMLNYLIEQKTYGHSEMVVLQLAAVLFPEHFKCLAELGYKSPSQKGGAAVV